jgi:predicted  nucleic acid-binding Zn-ribbon protein
MLSDVDAQTLTKLLDLQEEDLSIRRLVHQRDTLEEARRLEEMSETVAELEADIEIATKQQDEIRREQERIEGEMEIHDTKLGREEKRLFSGQVSNPKELSALQSEIEMLKRQKVEMEDSLLEVMVQRDQATDTLERLRSEHEESSAEEARLRETVGALAGDIDRELEEHTTRRTELVGEIPEALLSMYDQLREQKGGVGAARLEGAMCTGCHTTLPAVEVERLRAAGGVQRCDNCRRILVIG